MSDIIRAIKQKWRTRGVGARKRMLWDRVIRNASVTKGTGTCKCGTLTMAS